MILVVVIYYYSICVYSSHIEHTVTYCDFCIGLCINIQGGCYFLACKYMLCPTCSLLLPWRQTPLPLVRHFVPAGVRNAAHKHMFKSWLWCSGRKAASRGTAKKGRAHGFFESARMATQLRIYEVRLSWGGSYPARDGGYWRKRRRGKMSRVKTD